MDQSSKDDSINLLHRLSDPIGGMVNGGSCYTFAADEPKIFVQALDYSVSKFQTDPATSKDQFLKRKSASGSGDSYQQCVIPALGETLERHAACCTDHGRIFTATADELGEYALDLNTLASCSSRERLHPNTFVSSPRFDLPIRWVEGVSLTSGKTRAIPHSLVYLNAGRLSPQERLQVPISTGLAAHKTLMQAVISALLEVIERDALSIMWLQMIPGRRLEPTTIPVWNQSSSKLLRFNFFDITTDLGIPVVCCVRIAPFSHRVHTLLSAACGFDITKLLEKATRDICASSIGFRGQRSTPDSFDDFTAIHHGATFMADEARTSAFGFLLDSDRSTVRTTGVSEDTPTYVSPDSHEDELHALLTTLATVRMEAYAVDLTSVEAHSAGMHVVRVIVPGLQPLPYRYTNRYLGHPRLYDAPRRMGCRVLPESELNPWPLPFA